MTIVITGATGRLGGLTLDALLAAGVAADTIVAGGRDLDRLAGIAARGVRTAVVDYDKAETLDAAFAGADKIFFISSGLGAPGERVRQHRAVIAAAAAAGTGRLVYTSTLPGTILTPDHTATEQAIAESGVPATILRNGWYAENFLMDAERVAASGVYLTSAGEGRIAAAARRDYAEAAAAVLTGEGRTGRTYSLTGDTAVSGEEIAEAIGQIQGRTVPVQHLDPEAYRKALTDAGLPADYVDYLVSLDETIRSGSLDVDPGHELSALIGHPTTPVLEALRQANA